MRCVILSDTHGRIPSAPLKSADIIIAPGDFCSFQEIRPYLIKMFQTGTPWYDIVGRKKARHLIAKSLTAGRKVLEYLNSLGKPVVVIPGNWDWTEEPESAWPFLRENHYAKLLDGLDNIIDVHFGLVEIDEIAFVGAGISGAPEVIQGKRAKEMRMLVREQRAVLKDAKQILSSLYAHTNKPVVFLSHNPPYDTKFDKVGYKFSSRYGEHVGSLLARDFFGRRKTVLGACGHMHEHFGKGHIKKTPFVCTGYGKTRYAVVQFDQRGKLEKLTTHGKHC